MSIINFTNEKEFFNMCITLIKAFSFNELSKFSLDTNFTVDLETIYNLNYDKFKAVFKKSYSVITYEDNIISHQNETILKIDSNKIIEITPSFSVFPRKLIGQFKPKGFPYKKTLQQKFYKERNDGAYLGHFTNITEKFTKEIIKTLINNTVYFEIPFDYFNYIPYNFLKEPPIYTILDEPLESCPITFEPAEKTALTIKCKHKFSEEGLKGWLAVKKCCPLCRTDL